MFTQSSLLASNNEEPVDEESDAAERVHGNRYHGVPGGPIHLMGPQKILKHEIEDNRGI